jgi:hypothetical protein
MSRYRALSPVPNQESVHCYRRKSSQHVISQQNHNAVQERQSIEILVRHESLFRIRPYRSLAIKNFVSNLIAVKTPPFFLLVIPVNRFFTNINRPLIPNHDPTITCRFARSASMIVGGARGRSLLGGSGMVWRNELSCRYSCCEKPNCVEIASVYSFLVLFRGVIVMNMPAFG